MTDDQLSTSRLQQIKRGQIRNAKRLRRAQNDQWQKNVERLEKILLHDPARFDEVKLDKMFELLSDFPEYLERLSRRIFDVNEGTILNGSESNLGFLGRLNRMSRKRREKRYFRRINRGFRAKEGNKVILAEGDSWFEFPYFVTDIIDWLSKVGNYAIISRAGAGDWLSNMIWSGEYVESFPVHSPDVFLISGGGNDMVGEDRLTTMICGPDVGIELKEDWFGQIPTDDPEIKFGRRYLTRDFYAFLNLVRLQYYIMFTNIAKKYPDTRIITQGYDFAIPSAAIHWDLSPQPLLNWFLGSGSWLRRSFMLKGIVDAEIQRCVVKAMIHEFNEMMVGIANAKRGTAYRFPTVHHIDCRGIVDEHGWYDELHPKSPYFEKIACLYQKCIDADDPKRVYSKADL